MSAVSPEVAHAMSIALALCLNIVLAASVYADVESEQISQVLASASVAANLKRALRLLNCLPPVHRHGKFMTRQAYHGYGIYGRPRFVH